MNCPNCNKKLNFENSKFCEHCGSKIDSTLEMGNNVQNNEKKSIIDNIDLSKLPIYLKSKKVIGCMAAALVAIIVVIILVATHKTEINLAEFVKVDFSGYDTNGKATVKFYDEALAKAFAENADHVDLYNPTEVDELDDLEEYVDTSKLKAFYSLIDGLEWEIDKDKKLTNGDVINVTFNVNNEYAAEFGVVFENTTLEFEVMGLEKVKVLDPFAGVEVVFSGTSPDISARIEEHSTDPIMEYLKYSLSKDEEIKKGEVITVTILNDEDDFINGYGYRFKTVTKEFKCENVDEYISKLDQINEETLTSMKTQTEDMIEDYFAENKEKISKSDLKYEGCYMLTAKKPGYWDGSNKVYVIYSAKVKSKTNEFDTTTIYFPVEFTNIIEYVDGTQYVDLDVRSISGDTNIYIALFDDIPGFTSKGDMYSELVSAYKDDYTSEITEGLK